MWKILSVVFKVFLVLYGFGAIALGIGSYGLKSNSANWTGVEAQVVSSEYDSSNSSEGSGSNNIKITYKYVVGDTTYFSSDYDSTEKPAGEKITIYYDPNRPDVSTTTPGSFEFSGLFLLATGLFCVGSVVWGPIKSLVSNRKKMAASPLEK